MFHDASLVGTQCLFCSEVVDDISHLTSRHGIHLCTIATDTERPRSRQDSVNQDPRHKCLQQDVADYTFTRKDFLVQHVQCIHLKFADKSLKTRFKGPDQWSRDVELVGVKLDALWCGFCQYSFDRISDRMAHVVNHFRDCLTMETWISRSTG
jgi:hypothetical protein